MNERETNHSENGVEQEEVDFPLDLPDAQVPITEQFLITDLQFQQFLDKQRKYNTPLGVQ